VTSVSGVAHVGTQSIPVSASITLPTTTPPPAHPILTGVNTSPNDHGGFNSWPFWRVYQLGRVASVIASGGVKRIALSGDSKTGTTYGVANVSGGQTTADLLHQFLLDLYGQEGKPTKNTGLYVDWLHGNEQDRNTPGAAYFTTYDLCHTVIDKFDNARIGFDATVWNVKQGTTQNLYGKLAGKVEVFYASEYPPGRTKNPVEFTDYVEYVDPVADLAVAWGAKSFAIGETGIPVATADKNGKIDYTLRPAYMCGGTSSGSALYPAKTYVGLLQYVNDACTARGMAFEGGTYWDESLSGGPLNEMSHDETSSTPLAPRWRSWQPK
jgi:hypothetical protein